MALNCFNWRCMAREPARFLGLTSLGHDEPELSWASLVNQTKHEADEFGQMISPSLN